MLDATPGSLEQTPFDTGGHGHLVGHARGHWTKPSMSSDGGKDEPARLITTLQSLRPPFESRAALCDALTARGFSLGVAQWAATSLKLAGEGRAGWGGVGPPRVHFRPLSMDAVAVVGSQGG